MHDSRPIKRMTLLAACLAVLIAVVVPFTAYAEDTASQKVVRVGWYDSAYCYIDASGRRCGIAYEYQQRIAEHTGWTYEYVEESWPVLLEMLKTGEIDLLSDVSYTEERANAMLFSAQAMGTESYYIYIDADNESITPDDPKTLNGKKVGVNKGSFQEGLLVAWAEKNKLALEVVELTVDEPISMSMLASGEIDAYVSLDSFGAEERVIPLSKVGSSEYYFAVNKERSDLLVELNGAMNSILDENPSFNQRLFDQYINVTKTSAFLTPHLSEWLSAHGPIRIGYRDGYLPFCAKDDATGEVIGALRDYLAHASGSLRDDGMSFETVAYPTAEAVLEALEHGEVDCVFPFNMSSYDCEEAGLAETDPIMQTEMHAAVRASEGQGISLGKDLIVAVNAQDMNIDTFVKDKFPAWKVVYFPDAEGCFSAVARGDADCTLVSSYRVVGVQDDLERHGLTTVPTGESMGLSIVSKRSEHDLFSILNKTANLASNADSEAALATYAYSTQKVTFGQFLKDNWSAVVAAITLVFLIILALLFLRLKAERRARENEMRAMAERAERECEREKALEREMRQQEQLKNAMNMAYKDPLTGVKSKYAYSEAEKQMDQRIADDAVSKFSVVVFDLNDLKRVNDSRGHETGDEYIKDACKLICTCFKHSPVFRIGGDEFVAILEGEDYSNQDELLERFEKQVLMRVERDGAVVAFGSSRFDPDWDKSIHTVFDRADATMYKEKALLKNLGAAAREDGSIESGHDVAFEDAPVINVRKHILIADDIESNREILGDLLEDDYDIFYASDGVEAMEMLRSHKSEIALLILDLYMPNKTGQEVMADMQVDEDLMAIPVIVLTVDQDAELECLKLGAMDFIPKPYPDIEIVKARIAKCIELAENRDLIRRTQRDKLTGLFNYDYFIRYVSRYDQHYREIAYDAVACDINRFRSVNEQYGRQFGDLVLRSIGISMNKLARKAGGISCRKGMDTFLLYCPHQDDYDQLIEKFLADLFLDEETASKVKLRFGVFANAQQEPDVEERFVRSKAAADSVEDDPQKTCGFYEFD